MNSLPINIEIYLPNGDPQGLRFATLTASPLKAVEVPRALLPEFQGMAEAAQVGLYFLFSDEAEDEKRTVYIGETEAIGKRLGEHHTNPKMDFWTRAVVVVSASNDITKTHAKYLEWEGIRLATSANRYVVRNGNAGSKPHAPGGVQATCLHYLQGIRVFLAILGQPVMEPYGKPKDKVTPEDVFFCKGATYDATAEYAPDGMVVRKGSKARKDMVPSMAAMSAGKKRLALIEDGRLKLEGEFYVFQEDVAFGSPSGASDVVTGTSSNGWIVWKTSGGKTLDELKRPKGLSA